MVNQPAQISKNEAYRLERSTLHKMFWSARDHQASEDNVSKHLLRREFGNRRADHKPVELHLAGYTNK
jgi:hypothetical protein